MPVIDVVTLFVAKAARTQIAQAIPQVAGVFTGRTNIIGTAGAMLARAPGNREDALPQPCVICQHFQTAGRGGTSLTGLTTGIEDIISAAQTRLDDIPGGQPHIMAYVCAEHVIDIYRGRVPGVAMAWLVAPTP